MKASAAAPRIAFIKTGEFSHVNARVQALLSQHFPEAVVEVVETGDLPVWSRRQLPAMALDVFREYGISGCTTLATLERYGQRTPRFFEAARRQLADRLRQRDYLFTFQTQSIVDASQPGRPHFVYTDHTHLANLGYPAFDRSQLYGAPWIAKERSIYANAAAIFTMSSHVSRSLRDQYHVPDEKIDCVRLGSNIDIPPAGAWRPERYAGKHILFVGIDWERKGGPALVAAFRKVLARHPDATLTIIGCSPSVDVPNCRVLGHQPLARISREYLQASVFCMPTRIEPFGIVFLEAFAHRLPVVATDIGALPDVVRDGFSGYLTQTNDIDALADRLVSLIESPETCQRFGQAGFDWLTSQYTWERTGALMARRIANELQRRE